MGADLKMGLGPNLTLDATVNPDFGQVEADPAVVNLSAFEVFFDERRPFFTEGSQLFPTQFFYSRRVGARPRGRAGGHFVDYPEASTILGAAKLTGRLRSGASLGALAAVTAREYARGYDTTTATTTRTEVAPVTAVGVLRGQQEFGANQSTVGATFTALRRDFERGNPLAALYHREAYGGRLDWNIRFNRGQYVLDGDFGFSHVRGDSLALLRTQRSPVHYFQRPDADYVDLDPSRTSLTGYKASLSFSKNTGRWLYFIDFGRESPSFEPNDAGRLGNADGQTGFANLRYRETRPGKLFYNYTFSFETGGEWNIGNDRQFYTTRWDAELTFKNYWVANLTFWIDHPSQNHAQTRGGPSMGIPQEHRLHRPAPEPVRREEPLERAGLLRLGPDRGADQPDQRGPLHPAQHPVAALCQPELPPRHRPPPVRRDARLGPGGDLRRPVRLRHRGPEHVPDADPGELHDHA